MNLIFDFDGTICDSLEALVKIVNKYLPKYNESTISVENVRSVGIKAKIKSSKVSKKQIPKLMFEGRRQFSKIVTTLTTFPDIPEVIKTLSKIHRLGILTSNSEEIVKEFLKHHNLEKYFEFIYSEFDLFGKHNKLKKIIKKYSFDQSETFYVGDETRDVEAAKKAKIKSVAVTWGYESEEVLRKADPGFILTKPKELLKMFD